MCKKLSRVFLLEGYKNLSKDEWFFKVHWPEDPNMPAMLQTEAMVQMTAMALLTLPKNKGKLVYLLSAKKLQFKKKWFQIVSFILNQG